jgi:hypothetical protein
MMHRERCALETERTLAFVAGYLFSVWPLCLNYCVLASRIWTEFLVLNLGDIYAQTEFLVYYIELV